MRRLRIAALGRLAGDRRGAALLLFTVFLVPLLAVVAVGIDLSRFLLVKQRLINAADAAALAVGTRPNLTADEANAMAEAFIRAHYRDEGLSHLQSFSVTSSISQVGVTVHAQMETTFLKVLNVATLDVRISTQVARAQRKLEVVLALDNTGSMCQPSCAAKFDKLKVAANELVNLLFGADTVSDTVKVGLVPFSGAVNVGIDKIGSGWLDEAGLSSLQLEDINLPVGQTLLGLVGQILNVGWGGCVRARTGPNGYDLTDEPPNLAVGETLFVPYFAPDEPGAGNGPSGGYTNNYVDDTLISGDNVAKQRNALKYIGALISNANLARNPPQGPNYNCVPRPIQPLTNDKSVIAAAITRHGGLRQHRHSRRPGLGLARTVTNASLHGGRALWRSEHHEGSHPADRRPQPGRSRQRTQPFVLFGLRLRCIGPHRPRRRLANASGARRQDRDALRQHQGRQGRQSANPGHLPLHHQLRYGRGG